MIEINKKGKQVPCKIGKLTWIDLAGSESLAEIGVDRIRFFEGIQINESLKCLCMTIKQASHGLSISSNLHNLTKLMQDCLGGNSKTIMIANIGPSKYDITQTRETLEYAQQTGIIKNKPSNSSAESQILDQIKK